MPSGRINKMNYKALSVIKSLNYSITTIRRGFHVVSFYDGVKSHSDGSPFYDARTFKNYKDAVKFENSLRAAGYTHR